MTIGGNLCFSLLLIFFWTVSEEIENHLRIPAKKKFVAE